MGAVGAAGMLAQCGHTSDSGVPPTAGAPGGTRYFPSSDGSWQIVDPEAVGWRPEALEAAVEYAGDRAATGMVILSGGRILAERPRGVAALSGRDVASVQKSVIGVLIGIAQQAGHLRVDDPVTRWLGPGWSRAEPARESQILIRHLVSMSSGLDNDLRYSYPPGTRWAYNTPAYSSLLPLLERATGASLTDFGQRALFGPIGMSSAGWAPRGQHPAAPHAASIGLKLTARDMARFGLLVLASGTWANGRTVCDADFLRTALSPSQPANPSYGWLWWLNGKPSHQLPGASPQPIDGPLIPDAPGDLVAALGARDQKIYVVPSLDLVVTRQGGPAGARGAEVSSFDNAWWQALMAAAPHR